MTFSTQRSLLGLAVIVLVLCAFVDPVFACATCNVDGGSGQNLMLLLLLSVPLFVLGVGLSVVRKLLKRMEAP